MFIYGYYNAFLRYCKHIIIKLELFFTYVIIQKNACGGKLWSFTPNGALRAMNTAADF